MVLHSYDQSYLIQCRGWIQPFLVLSFAFGFQWSLLSLFSSETFQESDGVTLQLCCLA